MPAPRMVSVHVEVLPHLHRTITQIKKLGAKAGVVLNPSTPVSAIDEIAADVDFVLVMSVNPGFGGQVFIQHSLKKIRGRARAARSRGQLPRRLKSMAASTSTTVDSVVRAGADGSWLARRSSAAAMPSTLPRARSKTRPSRRCRRMSSEPSQPPHDFVACACGTLRPTRWASFTTRTIWSGSRSAAPIGCATTGWTYREMEADGIQLPVIEAHCEYRAGARYDDDIEIRTRREEAVTGASAV